MSTVIATKDQGAIHSTDRSDVTIWLITPNPKGGLQPMGIVKNFNFSINKPKTPIEVLSQHTPAGYARNPEDRTFSMSHVNTFERLDLMSYLTNSTIPFIIRIVYCNQTDNNGNPISVVVNGQTVEPQFKIIQLDGVEFENTTSAVDANGNEFTIEFTGRFRSGAITGDIDGDIDPVTYQITTVNSLPL